MPTLFDLFVAVNDWLGVSTTLTTEVIKMYRNAHISLTIALALLAGKDALAVCNPDVTITKPDNIYTVHGDGTVTDNETGLMWMQCSLGLSGSNCASGTAVFINWKEALEAVVLVNDGEGTYGYTDWRLPNVNELGSLAETACYDPAINTTIFPNTQSQHYWSSSPVASPYHQNRVRTIVFRAGDDYDNTKISPGRVRLVRSSQ